MVAIPIPETTYSHWSAPRWRLCGPPSACPGSKTISAACELGLPRTIRNPISNCRFFRFIHFSYLIRYRNLTAEKQRRFARRGGETRGDREGLSRMADRTGPLSQCKSAEKGLCQLEI